ncbi:TetR/AcrR family transcriptional regulator [Pseudomonas syringae]|uniref:TetR/AcrR family transcriptional regulator n=1 Tax=Pseudomonas syringae TaxID=317 RepID=UPI001B806E4C
MLRTKGCAAFSHADVAEEIGIKKASIHQHFPTKEGLAISIVESYLFRFKGQLESINVENTDASLVTGSAIIAAADTKLLIFNPKNAGCGYSILHRTCLASR